jgi:hypothetical protein
MQNWKPRAAVVIEPGLRRQSLPNGNIRGCGRRLFRRLAPCDCRFGSLETKSNERKAGISGPFSLFLGSLAERRTDWLGREGSNLRMVESKSGWTLSKIKIRSEFWRKFDPRNIKYLAVVSERSGGLCAGLSFPMVLSTSNAGNTWHGGRSSC